MKSYKSSDSATEPGAADDLLSGAPPQPKLRNASSSVLPTPSAAASKSSLAMMGATPIETVIEAMSGMEALVKKISTVIPSFASVAKPFITQMRDLGAAALADLSQGGTGAIDLGAGAPPPLPPGAAMPPGMPMGGGAGPEMMMPPPI